MKIRKPDAVALGSMWLFAGDGRSELTNDLNTLKGWVKILEKVDLDVACKSADALRRFFNVNNIEVFERTISD